MASYTALNKGVITLFIQVSYLEIFVELEEGGEAAIEFEMIVHQTLGPAFLWEGQNGPYNLYIDYGDGKGFIFFDTVSGNNGIAFAWLDLKEGVTIFKFVAETYTFCPETGNLKRQILTAYFIIEMDESGVITAK